MVVIGTWIHKSYVIEGRDTHFAAEVICSCFFIMHMAVALVRHGFSSAYTSSTECMLDCLTITPLLLQRAGPTFGGTWLTMSFLRVYRVYTAWVRLADNDFIEAHMSDVAVQTVTTLIQVVAVIFTIAGTCLILEGLGDIPGFYDATISSGMGDISFFQSAFEKAR